MLFDFNRSQLFSRAMSTRRPLSSLVSEKGLLKGYAQAVQARIAELNAL